MTTRKLVVRKFCVYLKQALGVFVSLNCACRSRGEIEIEPWHANIIVLGLNVLRVAPHLLCKSGLNPSRVLKQDWLCLLYMWWCFPFIFSSEVYIPHS